MGNARSADIGTLAGHVAEAADRLQAAGIPASEARRDAALLARFVLGWDAGRWLARSNDQASPDFPAGFSSLVGRRAAREPIGYITGEREFYGRAFHLTRDVLIPRPETELVVEEALQVLRSPGPWAGGPGPVLVDAGTGSGCLAVTLALECPAALITATDTSDAALTVARGNARRYGVLDRIAFEAAPLLGNASGIHLIVANLPYVREGDRRSLAPEVASYEPSDALFAGPDGLDFISELIPHAARSLVDGGWLVLEAGEGQSPEVSRLVDATGGLSVDHVARDLQGIERVIVARARRSHRHA
jgi:release factor glutamine methyltransferase